MSEFRNLTLKDIKNFPLLISRFSVADLQEIAEFKTNLLSNPHCRNRRRHQYELSLVYFAIWKKNMGPVFQDIEARGVNKGEEGETENIEKMEEC